MGKSPRSTYRIQHLFIVVVLLGATVAFAPAPPAHAAITPDDFENCLLGKINADRAAVGSPALAMASDLTGQIRGWSDWMRNNTFRHMTSSERNPILPDTTFTWGENIAMRSDFAVPDCSEIHNMLMNSSGHRANMLNSSFRFAALGAHGDASGWWVTELFFNAGDYPPQPYEGLCPDGVICDTVAFQDGGGKFHIWTDAISAVDDNSFYFGFPDDVAFSGDWDCDGVETLGLYRRSDGYVYLRNSNTQGVAHISYFFGIPGDFPVAGDFNGNGCDTVSIYRPSEGRFYVINELGSADGGLGAADYSFLFGVLGDKPFVGDFDGDGVDTVGLHRESSGLVYFRNSNTTGVAHFEFVYGIPNDMLVAGDWDGDGKDTIGVYRPSTGMFYIRNSNTAGEADATFVAGSYTGVVALRP